MWILEPKSCVYPKFRDWYGWIPSPQLRRTLRTAQLRKWELPPTLSSNLARSIMAGSMLSVWMAWQPAHIYGGFHSHGCTPPPSSRFLEVDFPWNKPAIGGTPTTMETPIYYKAQWAFTRAAFFAFLRKAFLVLLKLRQRMTQWELDLAQCLNDVQR